MREGICVKSLSFDNFLLRGWLKLSRNIALVNLGEGKLAYADDSIIKIYNWKEERYLKSLEDFLHLNKVDSDLGTRDINKLIYIGNDRIASGDISGFIKIWHIHVKESIKTFRHGFEAIKSITNIGKNKIGSICWDNILKIWDLEKEKCILLFKDFNGFEVIGEEKIAILSTNQKINIWNVNKLKCEKTLEGDA